MSTNYYSLKEPFVTLEKLYYRKGYVVHGEAGAKITIESDSDELLFHVLRSCFDTDACGDACAARVTSHGLAIQNRWWPDDYILLSEYGDLVTVGELKNPPKCERCKGEKFIAYPPPTRGRHICDLCNGTGEAKGGE
jgi:hypothetical protein